MTDVEKAAAIATARQVYAEGSDDDIQIDDAPEVSEADEGCWVQAWVWVPKADPQ